MKIGILSDTHNDRENTRAALAIFRREGVARLLHCGDVTAPDMIPLFQGWDLTLVLGNMDRDPAGLIEAMRAIAAPTPQQTATLTLDGVPLAMTHGHHDEALQELIESQQHRLVLHGHTHRRRDDTVGKTRVINPGALGGVRWQTRSIVVADLASGDVRFIEIN